MNEIINSKTLRYLSNILIGITVYFFLVTLVRYLSLKMDLNNPILSETLISEITNPVYYKTLFLFIAILLLCLLKYYKKNILVVVLSLIVILATVLVKESTIGWHTVIH